VYVGVWLFRGVGRWVRVYACVGGGVLVVITPFKLTRFLLSVLLLCVFET
jgi:hypothetical protein